MADPRIPLMVEQTDLTTPSGLFFNSLRQGKEDQVRHKLLDAQTIAQETQNERSNLSLSQEERVGQLSSMAQDALLLKPLLEGNSIHKSIAFLDDRIASIKAREGDPSHTEQLKDKLLTGNVDGVMRELDAVIGAAQQFGVIKSDLSSRGSVKIAQTATGYDLISPDGQVLDSVRDLGEANKLKLQLDIRQAELDKAKEESRRDKEKEDRGKESRQISLGSTAELFASTLSDPDIESATGIRGAVEGTVGRLTGSKAGILKGRLTRLGTSLTLQAAEALKGAMSDGDIKLLESTKPAGSDDVALWKDWYQNEYLPIIKSRSAEAGIEFSNLGLPESLGAKTTPETDDRLQKLREKHGL